MRKTHLIRLLLSSLLLTGQAAALTLKPSEPPVEMSRIEPCPECV